jgi:prepilin-type N-terminal cleavage/methylation domain-containing protein
MKKQQGFSAIELLITLFVAVIFFMAGYQLYAMIMKDGGEARRQSTAYNTLRQYMQKYKSTVGTTCAASTPIDHSWVNVSGLSSTSLTVDIQCPYGTTSVVSKVVVTLYYGSNPQMKVQDSTYAIQ